ncbi:MAG: flagellar basal body rod protein FlgB [Thermodesulfobacteria bacterium]|nr:flagellar basal body rod protein FlgB [Thermodesulfobacteriota bacterium]
MLHTKIFGQTWQTVTRSLKLRLLKHDVIAENIANVDTPGYKRRDIPFEKVMEAYLRGAPPLKTTNPRHLKPSVFSPPTLWPEEIVPEDEGTPNNVSLEEEMAKLAENNLLYQATVQALIKELELLREAITEGGKR